MTKDTSSIISISSPKQRLGKELIKFTIPFVKTTHLKGYFVYAVLDLWDQKGLPVGVFPAVKLDTQNCLDVI